MIIPTALNVNLIIHNVNNKMQKSNFYVVNFQTLHCFHYSSFQSKCCNATVGTSGPQNKAIIHLFLT